jgi:hypothetical protein
MPRDAREVSTVSQGEKVKYPVFAEPSVHGRIRVGCEGRPVGEFDGLAPGDVLEITGDRWRVVEIDYRTRIVLEHMIGGYREGTDVQPGE